MDFEDYGAGTITLTNGSTAFAADGAALALAGIRPGDDIRIKGWVATIATITGNNSGTLVEPWAQATQTAQPYRIRIAPDATRVAERARALIERLANGNIDALSELTLEADKLVFADGPNSLALTTLTAYARGLLTASDAAGVLTALGASAIGKALLTAANPGAAQDAIGATAVGKAVLTAADEAAAQTAIGATATGKAVLGAANPAAAQAAIGGSTIGKTVFGAADGPAAYGALGLVPHSQVPGDLPADKAFRRGNILGTVSQTGGVPSGAIIERGSNANGEYVRFADGTQICTVQIAVPPQTIASQAYVALPSVQFPAEFVAMPQMGGVYIGEFAPYILAAYLGTNATQTGQAFVKNTHSASITIPVAGRLSLVVMGRWF